MGSEVSAQSSILRSDRLALKSTAGALLATLLIPLLVHQLPLTGPVPVGARLLPMFYAPFLAVVFLRPQAGVIAGLLAPIINHLLTGYPAWPIVGILSIELTVFALLIALFSRVNYLQWVAAPLAYLLTKLVSAELLSLFPRWLPGETPLHFAVNSIRNAWMGIVILLILNIVAGIFRFRSRPTPKQYPNG